MPLQGAAVAFFSEAAGGIIRAWRVAAKKRFIYAHKTQVLILQMYQGSEKFEV